MIHNLRDIINVNVKYLNVVNSDALVFIHHNNAYQGNVAKIVYRIIEVFFQESLKRIN
jgi:hypothetical protein